MRFFNTFILLFLIIYPFVIKAQKEALVWPVGSGKQINFQSGSFEFKNFEGNSNTKSTICDKEGNLALYTDGRTVWNRNNEIVINGEKLVSDDAFQSNIPIFVPYPKKDGWYILFYEEEYYTITGGKYDNALYYAEINTTANNRRGEVVRQKIKIHDNYHSGPTIAGYCDNGYYWLVNDRNDNTVIEKSIDRIYCYKIDENGVNQTPVINEYFDIGNSGGYRFSPNGDKLFYFFGGNSIGKKVISDFNFKTGELYNHRAIDFDFIWQKEFSPDSKLLYFFDKGNLIQLDVSFLNSVLMMNSADTILTLGSNTVFNNPGQELQLGFDGKIYFSYHDIQDGKTKLGRINNPNNKGDDCNIELNFLTIDNNNFRFPEFVTSFFRDKHPEMMDEVFAKAGPDMKICSGSSVTLGFEETAKAFYNWTPAQNLSEPFSPQTILSPPKFYGHPKTDTYILRATDGNCWVNFDSTFITLNPIPYNLPIDGSWSVCPFVEEVDYWTVDDKNKLQWLADGGEIVSNPTKDSVKINWGVTNMKASASIFSVNQYGCSSDTSVYPVRINVELIKETPNGENKLCIAGNKNVVYQIRNTNGSVYNWVAELGEVVSGQGTNRVVVNWQGDGQHKLTVEETSTTIDTVCFGESEPLLVDIVNDSLEIELVTVSYDIENRLIVKYLSENSGNRNRMVFFILRNEFGAMLKEIQDVGPFDGEIIYLQVTSELNTEIISLKVVNSCNETFYSNQQQTIVVSGLELKGENCIRLNWNINRFWENDNLGHEIWYSENGQTGWKIVAENTPGTEFKFPLNGLSLTHFFRIREINRDKNLESWSNTINVKVEGTLTIPDIFTPNGDGINDEWEIRNVQFHPFQQAVIYNRYGQVIYECKNEFIPWDGRIKGEIIQGTYLYQITFDAENTIYGQITILQ